MSLNEFYLNKTPTEIAETFDILVHSADITLFWHFVFTLITVCIVHQGIRQGLEYWSKLMTSLLLLIILGLFCYNTTLDGFQQAKDFIFNLNLSQLRPSGMLQALGLAFFTLSLGQGIIITYGSYMDKKSDLPKTAFIIALMIIITSLLSALAIFPIIFSFGKAPEGGYGLVFKTLPILFAELPGALFLSTLFFILFVFAALTSAIAFLEVIVASCVDLYGWTRKKTAIFAGLATFLFGVPSAISENTTGIFANWSTLYNKSFFLTVDTLVSDWILPIGGLLIALFTAWRLDLATCKEEFMTETSLRWFWKPWIVLIRYLAPVGILLIMLQQSGVINVDTLFAK